MIQKTYQKFTSISTEESMMLCWLWTLWLLWCHCNRVPFGSQVDLVISYFVSLPRDMGFGRSLWHVSRGMVFSLGDSQFFDEFFVSVTAV